MSALACLSTQATAEGAGAVPSAAQKVNGVVRGGCPDVLLRRFDTYILPRTKSPVLPMRAITAAHIGKLVRVRVSPCNIFRRLQDNARHNMQYRQMPALQP